MRYTGTATAADLAASHRGHVTIYERLAERDPDAAAAAMREHILGSWLRRRARRPARGLTRLEARSTRRSTPGAAPRVAARLVRMEYRN